MSTCVRCSLPRDRHPVGSYSRDGQASYCVDFAAPAPTWMRIAVRLLRRR